MSEIINAHHKSITRETAQPPANTCNCRKRQECPLVGNCLVKSVIYQATVNTDQDSKIYIGLCDTEFKSRWNNHKSSFKLEHKRTQTVLSKHIWHLKDNNINFDIKWSILKHSNSNSNVSKRCQLCLWEYFIITADKPNILNSRNELISKCRHANKYLLKNIVTWSVLIDALHNILKKKLVLSAPIHELVRDLLCNTLLCSLAPFIM